MTSGGHTPRRFRYLVDENVSTSAIEVRREYGEEVLESRKVIGTQAPDRVLEWAAYHHNLILVSRDRDFKSIIKGVNAKEIRRTARTILLRSNEVQEGHRLRQCMPFLERLLRESVGLGLDIEYIQVLEDDMNVKYRLPKAQDPDIQ